ncbi:MAG: hypothetical protein NTX64_09355 [Elusimicrobia bacterium]|nr:hypothetical protein [Elusimicrobiota bacterium]
MKNLAPFIVAGGLLAALSVASAAQDFRGACGGQYDCKGNGTECAPVKDCCSANKAKAQAACKRIGCKCDSCGGILDCALNSSLKDAALKGDDGLGSGAEEAGSASKADDSGLPAEAKKNVGTASVYGYGEQNPDANTLKGIGIQDRPLTEGGFTERDPGAFALSPQVANSLGAKPGDLIGVRAPDGHDYFGYYQDRVPPSSGNGREIGFYVPGGNEQFANHNLLNGTQLNGWVVRPKKP